MSKKAYMFFDLIVLSIIACVLEGLVTWICNLRFLVSNDAENYVVSLYYVSFIVVFALIGLIRWNLYGLLPGIASSIAHIIVQNNVNNAYSNGHVIGTISGVCAIGILVLLFKKIPKDKIKQSKGLICLYCLFGNLINILTCAIVWSLIDHTNFLHTLNFGITGGGLSNFFISVVILLIASKSKGFLVDMNDYLIYLNSTPESARIREEMMEEKEHSITAEIQDSSEVNDIALLDGGMLTEEQLIELNNTFKEKEGERADGTRKS